MTIFGKAVILLCQTNFISQSYECLLLDWPLLNGQIQKLIILMIDSCLDIDIAELNSFNSNIFSDMCWPKKEYGYFRN